RDVVGTGSFATGAGVAVSDIQEGILTRSSMRVTDQPHPLASIARYNVALMSTNVRDILDRIRQLSEAERLELAMELDRQEEIEWSQLLTEARQETRRRGIDDEAIARAVESLRYKTDDAPQR